jgi:hypothetical protein
MSKNTTISVTSCSTVGFQVIFGNIRQILNSWPPLLCFKECRPRLTFVCIKKRVLRARRSAILNSWYEYGHATPHTVNIPTSLPNTLLLFKDVFVMEIPIQ